MAVRGGNTRPGKAKADPLADWRIGDPNRQIVLGVAKGLGYPEGRTTLKPGAWMKRAGKVDAFRAQKRALGIGA